MVRFEPTPKAHISKGPPYPHPWTHSFHNTLYSILTQCSLRSPRASEAFRGAICDLCKRERAWRDELLSLFFIQYCRSSYHGVRTE